MCLRALHSNIGRTQNALKASFVEKSYFFCLVPINLHNVVSVITLLWKWQEDLPGSSCKYIAAALCKGTQLAPGPLRRSSVLCLSDNLSYSPEPSAPHSPTHICNTNN